MAMPGRNGYAISGGWASDRTLINGQSFPIDLNVNSRSNNTPPEYTAANSVNLIDEYEDGGEDEYMAYISDASNTSGSSVDGSGITAANGYRYGFNGKEKDNDMDGNNYDYGFRIYNPGLGRFLSVDPLAPKYPFYTPYQFAGNKPIVAMDMDGAEDKYYHVNIDIAAKGQVTKTTPEDITPGANTPHTNDPSRASADNAKVAKSPAAFGAHGLGTQIQYTITDHIMKGNISATKVFVVTVYIPEPPKIVAQNSGDWFSKMVDNVKKLFTPTSTAGPSEPDRKGGGLVEQGGTGIHAGGAERAPKADFPSDYVVNVDEIVSVANAANGAANSASELKISNVEAIKKILGASKFKEVLKAIGDVASKTGAVNDLASTANDTKQTLSGAETSTTKTNKEKAATNKVLNCKYEHQNFYTNQKDSTLTPTQTNEKATDSVETHF